MGFRILLLLFESVCYHRWKYNALGICPHLKCDYFQHIWQCIYISMRLGVINDPVIHSMGLKMECNTRRFMLDDKRELQYRVEVQNRVYKKELAALDIEIGKLEKLLETPSSTSSSDLSIPRLIKHELAVVNEENEKFTTTTSKQQRAPSIGGGLPLLLLSVLPPVIPRASWPSADIAKHTMRKSVTFSSQPQLEDESSVARLPAIDLLHLRLTHQQATADERNGLIDRIIGMYFSVCLFACMNALYDCVRVCVCAYVCVFGLHEFLIIMPNHSNPKGKAKKKTI